MKFLQKIPLEWPLRLALGVMYLYSGYDLIVNPQHWYGFVPQWFSRAILPFLPIDSYLRIQGAGEFLMGFLFLAWFLGRRGVRVASLLATIEMVLILLFVGIDPITFRDIGLLGGTLATFVLSLKGQKRPL